MILNLIIWFNHIRNSWTSLCNDLITNFKSIDLKLNLNFEFGLTNTFLIKCNDEPINGSKIKYIKIINNNINDSWT